MIFSKRLELKKKVLEWLETGSMGVNATMNFGALGTITALDALGYLKSGLSVKEQLQGITHPAYLEAKIDPDVTWILTCKNCGGTHKFSTDTTELDPCCTNPNFGEIRCKDIKR